MAILNQITSSDGPITGWPVEGLVTPGQHVVVCLAVKDTMGHTRPTYENPDVMETLDMTRFLFGLPDGSMIQTGEMKISSHEKSRLVGFLTGWLARPPLMNGSWDYAVMAGQGAMISIVHKVSQKGRTYADIAAVSPVMEQLVAQVPLVSSFQIPTSSAEVQKGGTYADMPSAQPFVQPVQQVQQPAPQVQQPVQQVQPGFTQVQSAPF